MNNRLLASIEALNILLSFDLIDKHRICVVGGSMGGHVAIRLAKKNSLVKALILVSAAAYGSDAEGKYLNDAIKRLLEKGKAGKILQYLTF